VPGNLNMMMLRMRTCGAPRATGSQIRLVAVAVAVGLVGVAGCSSASTSAPSPPPPSAAAPPAAPLTQAYQSPDGYSISAPAGWIFHPTDGQNGLSSLFGAPTADRTDQKPFVANINVVITATADSLDNLVSQTRQQAPTVLANFKVVTDQPTTVAGGHPAYLLGGTYDQQGTGSLENLQLLLVEAGKQYTVTFTSPAGSFSTYQASAQAALASFNLG
jgi:DcrB